MAGFGLVLGGAAEGFTKGVKLAKDYETQKRQQELDQGQRESEAIMSAIPLPGTEVEGNFTPDKVISAALEKAKPKQDLIQRMGHAVTRGLRIHDAALASGVTPPPAAAPTAGAPAAEGAMPEKEVEPLTVTAAGPRQLTDSEHARLMLAAASRLKGPDAQQHVQAAWENLHKVEGEEFNQDVSEAAIRGPDALANLLEKRTGRSFELTPVEGKSGVYKVAVDGNPTGQEMTMAQMHDAVVGMAKKDPSYALQAGLLRNNDDREARTLALNTEVQHASIALRKAQIGIDSMVAKAQVGRIGLENKLTQAQLDAMTQEKGIITSFQNKIWGQNGEGDALLNAEELTAMAQAAPMSMKSAMTSKVVTDPETQEQHVVTVNNAEVMATAAIKAAQLRYNASPFVKGGVLAKSRIPLPDGNVRSFYTVKGVDSGAFTNLDAAEMAARRLYPKLAQPAKPPAKAAPARRGLPVN